jgi:hypothetical protein
MTTERQRKTSVDREQVKRWQANLGDEIDGIEIYRLLAAAEGDAKRRGIFEELAAVEEHHARVFREKLLEAGVQPKEHGPGLRVRLIGLGAGVRRQRGAPIVRSRRPARTARTWRRTRRRRHWRQTSGTPEDGVAVERAKLSRRRR